MLEDYTELLYVNVSYKVLALTLILRQMCANAHFGAQISWPRLLNHPPNRSRAESRWRIYTIISHVVLFSFWKVRRCKFVLFER